jgi:CxxC-x17-CxxC domain-containing protein
MFTDKKIVCKNCGYEFVFSPFEQELFAKKEYADPIRCHECRSIFKVRTAEMFNAICVTCGRETKVPFEPADDRKVFCRNCLHNIRLPREEK